MSEQEVLEAVQAAIEEAGGPGVDVDGLSGRIMQAVNVFADEQFAKGFEFGKCLAYDQQ